MKKILLINASPKKKFSASDYFLKLQRIFLKGEVEKDFLRNKGDYKRILEKLKSVDMIIFSTPLYVDSLPAHLLSFLKEMEIFCKENKLDLKVYAISNNGFIEGRQNETLFSVLENFCIRSNISWCGGLGIGGGVMFNVQRIVLLIETIITILNVFVSGILYRNWFLKDVITNLLVTILIIIFLHLGVLFYMAKMGRKINEDDFFGEKYTRILLPSFVFILFADAFFVVLSIFKGGIFKGWLKKK